MILMNFAALARCTSYSQKMIRKKVSDFRFFHHSEIGLCRKSQQYSLIPHTLEERKIFDKCCGFYLLRDAEWISWLQKVFWHLWGPSIAAEEWLKALESVSVLRSKRNYLEKYDT